MSGKVRSSVVYVARWWITLTTFNKIPEVKALVYSNTITTIIVKRPVLSKE